MRVMSDDIKQQLENYVSELKIKGFIVQLPHQDDNQNKSGYEICQQNMRYIKKADEIHIFYNNQSKGLHFDLGMAFILKKPIIVVQNELYSSGKSFSRMLKEWEKNGKRNIKIII
jgi:nucleoside 2-deoxyribosyltransferase